MKNRGRRIINGSLLVLSECKNEGYLGSGTWLNYGFSQEDEDEDEDTKE